MVACDRSPLLPALVYVCASLASNRRSRLGREGLEVESKFAGTTPTLPGSTGTA